MDGINPVYTDKELADRWRCEPRLIQDMRRDGRLTGFKVGREWRYAGAVIAAIEAGAQAAPTALTFASRRRRAA